MRYWGEVDDQLIRLWNTEKYPSHWAVRHEITDQGYRGDSLQSSSVVYLGSCDVMTNLPNGNDRWSRLLHLKNAEASQPFIALGTVATSVPTMIRRLYAYIQNFGAPKTVYMTIPRFDSCREFVTRRGQCFDATRTGTAYFAHRSGMIEDDELQAWLKQIEAHKAIASLENTRNILEERFAFIELLCRHHGITLFWTFNPSDGGIVGLWRYLDVFRDISPFMKNACAGVPVVADHQADRSIGVQTHRAIFEQFNNGWRWDFEEMTRKAVLNHEWLRRQYGDDLVKNE